MSAEPGFSKSVRSTALTFERGPDHGKRTTIVKTLHTGKENIARAIMNHFKKDFFSLSPCSSNRERESRPGRVERGRSCDSPRSAGLPRR